MSKRKDNKCTQDYECDILKIEENRTKKLSIQAQHDRLEHEKHSYSNTKKTNRIQQVHDQQHLQVWTIQSFAKYDVHDLWCVLMNLMA